MPPRKPRGHVNPSSVAAPRAVAKDASRREGSRHAGSSRTRSKDSEEEFDLREIEDGSETSDSSVCTNPSPELQERHPQQAVALNVPVKNVKKGVAVDLLHFFQGYKKPRKGQPPTKRICNLCSYVWTF